MADAKMTTRNQKVLFFLLGMVPTEDDLAIADDIKGRVMFRNGSLIDPEDKMEPCDAVAGHVPPSYSTKPRVGRVPTAPAAVKVKKSAAKSEPPKPDWQPNGSE